ncbi:MAG: tyrosine-type recombinase/integrase [Haloarculaceae archaeon]
MDPREMPPREAMQRWINQLKTGKSAETVETYYYRLKLFVEWAEGQGIAAVSDLDGWTLDSYENARLGEDIAPTSLQNEMKTLKRWLAYLERVEAVDDGLSEKVHIPEVPETAQSDEEMLDPEDAIPLLQHYRSTPAVYGTTEHAWLELAWHTGARMGGLRALDVRDYDSDDRLVEFVHRPETETPLKNKRDGERPVAFPAVVADVLDRYVEYHRHDRHDDHGRQPLFASQSGRPATNTMRVWSYRATFPCLHSECPHGKVPETCEFKSYHQASKCPSSRSPHKIRTGSITWQRDLGFPPEVVAERVNASVEVIEQYYDHASARERLEQRRRPYIEQMAFDTDDTQ